MQIAKYNYILGHDECRLIDSPCISKRRGKLYATSSFQTSAGSQQSSGFYSLKQISSVMHSIKKIFKQARCFLSYYQGKQVDSKHKHHMYPKLQSPMQSAPLFLRRRLGDKACYGRWASGSP